MGSRNSFYRKKFLFYITLRFKGNFLWSRFAWRITYTLLCKEMLFFDFYIHCKYWKLTYILIQEQLQLLDPPRNLENYYSISLQLVLIDWLSCGTSARNTDNLSSCVTFYFKKWHANVHCIRIIFLFSSHKEYITSKIACDSRITMLSIEDLFCQSEILYHRFNSLNSSLKISKGRMLRFQLWNIVCSHLKNDHSNVFSMRHDIS